MSENARELRRQRMQDYVKDLVSAVLNAHSHTYNVDYYLMETWKADFKKAIEPSGNVWFYYSERNYNAIASRLYDIAHTAHDLDSFFFTNSDRKRVVSDFYTPVKILLKLRDAGKIDPLPSGSLGHSTHRIAHRQASLRKIVTRGPAREGGLYL